MKPPLYNEVLEIALSITNASENNDKETEWTSYQELLSLCKKYENTELNHPYQWEAIADFTQSATESIKLYEKALKIAVDNKLNDYTSSILFGIAESYSRNHNHDKSLEFAIKANDVAKTTNDLDLRKEISEFILRRHRYWPVHACGENG